MAEVAKKQAERAAKEARAKKLEADDAYSAGDYIVTLRGNPAATYTGGLKSYARTQPEPGNQLNARSKKVVDYSAHLEATQRDVAKEAGVTISQQYSIATNGFASTLTAAQAAALAQDPRVESLTKSRMLHIQAEDVDSGVHFLGLDGDNGVWSKLGGIAGAGKGIVIGELDTGIAPENKSFAGAPLSSTSEDGAPTISGDATTFAKADGGTFHGICQSGETKADQFDAADCNSKIVGARYFAAGFGGREIIATPENGEYLSPRDGEGHGSHTASTAAGDNGVKAIVNDVDMGAISGVAPAAKIAVYKICWTGANANDTGCAEPDSLAAIDQAIKDGVDVINYSVGGGAARTTASSTDMAFLNAAVAGVFVAAAGGNDGPDVSTVANAAPWITTVAASTIHSPEATAALGNGAKYLGVSISLPDSPVNGALVAGSQVGIAGTAAPENCAKGSLDKAKVDGKIVFCERDGKIARAEKSQTVKDAGGIGMVLVNSAPNSVDPDVHSVPTIHIDSTALAAIRAYAVRPDATVTMSTGNSSGAPSFTTPQIAGFSSRGPLLADGGDLVKPDLTAPGVGILAATNNAEGAEGTYAFESGTSMATPHVAGLAALYLGVHPEATPSEVKSALMTTSHDLVDASGKATEDVFAQGAGEVDPTKFLDPGLLYLNGQDDWYRYLDSLGVQTPSGSQLDPSDLNLASIGIGALPGTQTVTRTVTATHSGTFTADPVNIKGITTVVEPSTFTLSAGQTQTFTVTFTRTDAALNVFATGYLRWRDGTTTVTSAIAVRPSDFGVPGDVVGTGTSGTATIPVSEGIDGSVDVTTTGLTKGVVVHGTTTADKDKVAQAYTIDLPSESNLLRFDLDAARDDVDLDLSVAWMGADGNTVIDMGSSMTNAADERVDLAGNKADAGRWVARVYGFEGTGPMDYTLSIYAMNYDNSSDGNFTATPSTLPLVKATTGEEKVSWSGLDAGSNYLGLVNFGDNKVRTAVTVHTPGTAPAPSHTDVNLTIAADSSNPDDSSYVRAGQPNVEMLAPGLKPDDDYALRFDSSADVITSGKADSTGLADRVITIPADLPVGKHTATLEYAGGKTVTTTFTVSTLTLLRVEPDPDQNFGGVPAIPLSALFNGNGTIAFSMTDADGKSYLYQEKVLTTEHDFEWFLGTVKSNVAHPMPGVVKASAWVVEPGGVVGQRVDIEFTVNAASNGSASFTQADDDPAAVDFDLVHTGPSLLPTFVYKLCSGPMYFAELEGESHSPEGLTSVRLDMHGVTSIKVVLAGNVLARYTNRDASRCAEATPSMDFSQWVKASDNSATDSEHPIGLSVTNAYPTGTYGLKVMVGTGTWAYGEPDLSTIGFPITYVKQTPVPDPITRSLDVASNIPTFARTEFEQELLPTKVHPEGGLALIVRRTLVQALTPDMLAAIDPNAPIPADPDPNAPVDPGTPDTGNGDGGAATPAAGGPRGGLAATGIAIGLPILAGGLFALLLGSVLVYRRRRTDSEMIGDHTVGEIE